MIFIFLTISAWAQQNFFNAVSSQITPAGQYFYQGQLNMYQSAKVSQKNHLVRGLRGNQELGLNVTDLILRRSPQARQPKPGQTMAAALSYQKAFQLSRREQLSIGTQILSNTDRRFGDFTYLNYKLNFKSHDAIVIGTYVTDHDTVESGDTVGLTAGYEFFVTKNFALMGDYISGENALATSVHGFMYEFEKNKQVCVGYQLRSDPDASIGNAFVLELNLINL